eukprot:s4641_g6.t1
MRLLMSQMQLQNEANFCYCNAVLSCLWWSILSRTEYQPGDWGSSQASMLRFFSRQDASPQSLQSNFSALFQLWDHGTLPADAAEFAYYAMSWMNPPCISHRWGRFYMVENARFQHDLGDIHAPIFLQVPNPSITAICLQDLVTRWTQEYGMMTALLDSSDVLLCHVDRTADLPDGTLLKLDFWLHADHVCAFPSISADGNQVSHDYVPIAMLAHQGDLHRGHYRAALRLRVGDGLTALHTQQTLWAITDDHQIPQIYQLPGLPEWFCRNLTLICLVKLSAVDIYRPLRNPDTFLRLHTLRKASAINLAADAASDRLQSTAASADSISVPPDIVIPERFAARPTDVPGPPDANVPASASPANPEDTMASLLRMMQSTTDPTVQRPP